MTPSDRQFWTVYLAGVVAGMIGVGVPWILTEWAAWARGRSVRRQVDRLRARILSPKP